jgi:acetoin:2,6-dichlorophenolindophenol oxidoreductase subunit alpha
MDLPDRHVVLDLFRQMCVLRQFEEAAGRSYREGKIPGFIHLYIGEEAVATGVCAHLKETDFVASTHRGHGHALAKGVPARQVMAELWGRSTGCSGGRGGSMHLYAPEHGFLGSNGIVGGGIPMAGGAAFSAKYRGTSQVSVSFFGDGANNLGAFHETLNLASLWKLPAVFVCENNLYATQMSFLKSTAGQNVAVRAAGYAMPGVQVDGQDVLTVYQVAGEAVARARAGEGPTLIECLTYRFGGHHEGDPGTGYRSDEEIAAWKQREPIQMLAKRLLAEGTATQDDLDGIGRQVEAVIQDALTFSEQSLWPLPEEAATKVFAHAI